MIVEDGGRFVSRVERRSSEKTGVAPASGG
jgi:hypothetical protein